MSTSTNTNRTNVTLDRQLWRAAKLRAAQRDSSIGAIIDAAVEAYLAASATADEPSDRTTERG